MRDLVVSPNQESADNRTTLDNKEFGAFLKTLRLEVGLTQKEASERTYETVPYIRFFEKGQRVPQAGRAANLFRWYGVPCKVLHHRDAIILVVKDTRVKFLAAVQRPPN